MIVLCVVAVLLGLVGKAEAWIYQEHRDIALMAFQGLDSARKADFDRLWQDARAGNETHLCGQRVDPEYATRAESNDAHFLMPRPDTNLDPYDFVKSAVKAGNDINALGVYKWYHLSALQKASRLANEKLTPEQKRALTWSVLFDEAFARGLDPGGLPHGRRQP